MRFLSGYDLQLDKAIRGRDIPPAVPNAMDDEFDDNTFDTSKWTWLDQGSWTASEANGRLILNGPASDGNRIRGVYQTLPTPPCSFEAKIYIPNLRLSVASVAGLFIAENTSGGVVFEGFFGAPNAIRGLSFTSPSSAAAGLGDSKALDGIDTFGYFWSRIDWDGTDYSLSYSIDPGGGWLEQHTASPSFTPTLIGIGFGNSTALPAVCSYGWFRRVI